MGNSLDIKALKKKLKDVETCNTELKHERENLEKEKEECDESLLGGNDLSLLLNYFEDLIASEEKKKIPELELTVLQKQYQLQSLEKNLLAIDKTNSDAKKTHLKEVEKKSLIMQKELDSFDEKLENASEKKRQMIQKKTLLLKNMDRIQSDLNGKKEKFYGYLPNGIRKVLTHFDKLETDFQDSKSASKDGDV